MTRLRVELDGWNFRFEKLSISRIYDYIWVEIAYGLEKIVLMPRTWSVRIFAKKTPCLVASIVTLRIRVETDPGHDYWRKLLKVCQADLDLKDWVRFHGDIWKESELKIKFLDKYHFNLRKSKFALPSGSNISMNNPLIF